MFPTSVMQQHANNRASKSNKKPEKTIKKGNNLLYIH